LVEIRFLNVIVKEVLGLELLQKTHKCIWIDRSGRLFLLTVLL